MAATIQTIQKPTRARALDTSTSYQIVGPQLITAVKNTDFSASPDWAAFDPDGGTSATAALDSARWKVTSTTDTDREGTHLALSNLGTLTAGAKYRITCDLQATTAGFTLTVGMGGAITTQVITTSNVTYNIDLTIDNTAGSLRFYTEESTARIFHMDNITVHKLESFGNNNHGQIYSGRALEFDGITDYLNLGEKKTLVDYSAETTQANRAWTVACWINVNDYSSIAAIIGGGYTISSTYFCVHSSGKIGVWDVVGGGTPAWRTGDKVVETGVWYRAVVVFDGDENVTFYLNGVQDGSSGVIDTSGHNADLVFEYIGRRSDSSPRLWDGKLSDLQLWQGAWTADDVLYDYNNPEQLALNRGGTSLTNSNLKAWYPMNDGHRGQQSYILDASNTGLGDDVMVNGGFDTDSSWNKNSNWTISDGVAISDGSSTNNINQGSVLTIGTTYKVVFDIVSITSGLGYSVRLGTGNSYSESFNTVGTHTLYQTCLGNEHFYITTNGAGTIDNVKAYPVNEKNHATTVFYGDELITNGTMEADSNWADYNSVNANVRSTTQEHSGTYSRKFTVDGASQGIQSDAFTTVTGRTYLLSFEIYPDDATSARIAIRKGDNSDWADDTSFSGLTQDAWNTKTVTYTESAGGSGAYLVVHGHNNTSGDFYVDDVSIKEVGTASGWTDADQQLDIPQTALQSYNQLAWFDGYASDTAATLDSTFYFEVGQTINMWVFPNVINQYDSIFGARETENYMRYQKASGSYSTGNDLIQFEPENNTAYSISADAGGTLEVGKWQMYTFIWNTDRTIDFYVNGIKIADSSATADTTDGKRLKVGHFGAGYGTSALPFEGAMTEISYWNAGFNSSEVTQLYNDGKALDATLHTKYSEGAANLTGYWRNNGLAEWKDLRGSNDANVDSAETMLITAGADGSRDSQGFLMNNQRTTNSLNLPYFTASDGYLMSSEVEVKDLGDNFDFGTGHFSVSAWIKKRLSGKAGYIVTCQDTGYQNMGFHIRITSGNDLAFVVGDGSNFYSITHDTNLDDGEWHNVVGVYTATTGGDTQGASIYIDGIYKGRDHDGTELGAINTSSGVRIGGKSWSNIDSNSTQMYDGQIDDVLIYKGKALDDGLTSPSIGDTAKGEIARNYNAGKRSHR